MAERQTNYTIAEGYELPSKGLIYDTAINAHVELRSMTARDEMKRLNPSTTQFKTLADIIEGCMLEKPTIHVYDMALADYEYLLHKLRVVTYGDEYKMSVRCPHCGSIHDATVHLDDLETREFDIDAYNTLKEVKLPKSGDIVVLKPQTPRMLDMAEARVKEFKRKFKDADMQFDTIAILALVVDTINGKKLNSMQVEDYLLKLPAADLLKIQNVMEKLNNSFGLDTTIIVDCKECGGEILSYFRFGPEFFRPSSI